MNTEPAAACGVPSSCRAGSSEHESTSTSTVALSGEMPSNQQLQQRLNATNARLDDLRARLARREELRRHEIGANALQQEVEQLRGEAAAADQQAAAAASIPPAAAHLWLPEPRQPARASAGGVRRDAGRPRTRGRAARGERRPGRGSVCVRERCVRLTCACTRYCARPV